jgi:hypothetical protein
VLAALEKVIDDDAALGRICADSGEAMLGEPLGEPLRAANPRRAADRRYLP